MVGDFGDRGDLALAEKQTRMFEQAPARPPFGPLRFDGLFPSAAFVCELHANETVGVSAAVSLSRPCKARPVPASTRPWSTKDHGPVARTLSLYRPRRTGLPLASRPDETVVSY